MKTLTFDEARHDFEHVYDLAARGETVVIERDRQRVVLLPCGPSVDLDLAPPGCFAGDFTADEVAELNAFAAQAPARILP